jgi:hypothetical protein
MKGMFFKMLLLTGGCIAYFNGKGNVLSQDFFYMPAS